MQNDKNIVEHIFKTNASAVERVNNKGIDTNKKYILVPFLLSGNKQKIICSFAQYNERGMILLLQVRIIKVSIKNENSFINVFDKYTFLK